MTTILITGFGRFPGAPFNPSAPLACAVGKRRRPAFADARRVVHIFETSYAAVDRELPELMAQHRPDIVLMFGLAGRTPFVRIETRARNTRSVLFPDVIGPKILPTRQEVFYFATPPGDRRFLPGTMPGWADFNGGDMFYGTPDLESRGVKFAHDLHGVEVDPDTQDRRASAAGLAEIVSFRDRRFPALRGAQLTGAEVCQYENSSNGDFLIDFHPVLQNVLLLGGGSGHGFKHGPEVGRTAAARLFGLGQAEPRFSLATKSEVHHREVH